MGAIGASPPLVLQVVDEFRQAARNAVEAGFDGVEIHAANVSACAHHVTHVPASLASNAQSLS